MSESTGVVPRTEEADTEVELSAQDLLALSDSRHFGERETARTSQPSRLAASAIPRKTDASRASTNRYLSASRLSLSLIVTVALVGSAYVLTISKSVNHPTANTSERTTPSKWPPPQQQAEGEPVRFANPFDTDEVFAFPPGTSETEAREAVAELLMERAMARQQSGV